MERRLDEDRQETVTTPARKHAKGRVATCWDNDGC